MARAEILIEDAAEGPQHGAAVRFLFPEGFDAASPAHQLANILRIKLEEMTTRGELTALDEPTNEGDMGAANDDLQQRKLELVTRDE